MDIHFMDGCWVRDGSWREMKIKSATELLTPKLARAKALIDCGPSLTRDEMKIESPRVLRRQFCLSQAFSV
jgi:hypothetical protein